MFEKLYIFRSKYLHRRRRIWNKKGVSLHRLDGRGGNCSLRTSWSSFHLCVSPLTVNNTTKYCNTYIYIERERFSFKIQKHHQNTNKKAKKSNIWASVSTNTNAAAKRWWWFCGMNPSHEFLPLLYFHLISENQTFILKIKRWPLCP